MTMKNYSEKLLCKLSWQGLRMCAETPTLWQKPVESSLIRVEQPKNLLTTPTVFGSYCKGMESRLVSLDKY